MNPSETNNRLTFTDIVPLPFNKRMTIGVVKFKTEQEAKNMILKNQSDKNLFVRISNSIMYPSFLKNQQR